MSKKNSKTNVMRLLDQHQIDYRAHTWQQVQEMHDDTDAPIFKTLVTVGKSGDHYVFVIPVESELDLKKAAQAVSEKNIHMIKEKELLPLTGYVHGGCSPIGMKKFFTTIFDNSALMHDRVIFSAGKVGESVEIQSGDIERCIPVEFVDVKAEV